MATMVNASGELVYISQYYAAMYWGFVLSTSFVGISLVQGYLYFVRSNNDRWSVKALVISLLIFDPATSILMAELIYQFFVVNFGDVAALGNVPTSWVVENVLTVLVTAMVQVFFASRVYFVNKAVNVLPLGRTAPVLVFAFALVAFVAGTVRTIFIGVLTVTSFPLIVFQITVTIEESFALMSDILSSICLCYMLAPPRLGSMRWSESLKAMFMFTINRAILMSFIQIGMLASYLCATNELYWIPFHLSKSKLYTNTLLAMLNSRSGGSFQSQISPWRTPTINLTIKESGGVVRHSMCTSEWDVEKMAPLKENVAAESNLLHPASPGPS